MNYNLSDFTEKKYLRECLELFFVVKSLDQKNRRKKMVQNKINGRYGRIKSRITSKGLFGRMSIIKGNVSIDYKSEYREPRHLKILDDRYFLLSEINRILIIDKFGDIKDTIVSDWFSYLHTIELNNNKTNLLVVSSGFDSVIEVDINSRETVDHWCAWEHGFNPDRDGYYLAKDKQIFEKYLSDKKISKFINPHDFGEQGILTSRRTSHPNYAIYLNDNTFLIGIGRTGSVYIYDKLKNSTKTFFSTLHQMNHGLTRIEERWMATDTTVGKVVLFDMDFNKSDEIIFTSLGGKASDSGNSEWLQNTIWLKNNEFLSIDSNRGLIHFNLDEKTYSIYRVNDDWCIQDILYKEC